MKPTKEQIDYCEFLKSMISMWEHTNDINSPTHISDIQDMCNAECYEDLALETIDCLSDLYWLVRRI